MAGALILTSPLSSLVSEAVRDLYQAQGRHGVSLILKAFHHESMAPEADFDAVRQAT